MAQFDIYENRDYHTRHSQPYYLDVQSELLQSLATRIVIPLIQIDSINHPVDILNPVVRIGNENLYLSSAQLCSINKRRLGKRISNVANQRAIIDSSMGLLFDID
jgi:toxin CcdB